MDESSEPVRKRPRQAEHCRASAGEDREVHPLLTESWMQERLPLERRAAQFAVAKRTLEGV